MDVVNFDALKAQGRILDLADVDPNEDYLIIGKYTNKYTTDNFKYTKYPIYAIKAKDLIEVTTDGVTITGTGTIDDPLVAVPSSQFQYEIGQHVAAQGGVIANRWLSNSAGGSPTSGTIQNYLVVDIIDLATGTEWATSNVDIPNVESTWNGKANTIVLINAGVAGGITTGTAAQLCEASINGGKNDWYLPAIDELNKVWDNRWEIAQGLEIANGSQLIFNDYWSSTEYTNSFAWGFDFVSGAAYYTNKNSTDYVRAVRKFSI
jgi:hypothetical protein